MNDSFPLLEKSIVDLQAGINKGMWTTRDLCQRYFERIEKVDRSGPAINAIIEINQAVLVAADRLDRERANGQLRGPLHGIPILIKDNINTVGPLHTTAGSLALARSIPDREASILSRLQAAGALILGKTNLSEWANFRSTRSTSGWSSRGGQTRNPYALDRNPSGSSSGSGAAIAANLAAAALGTETDGSIVSPAAANGIVGLKPTVGLVSRHGIIPIAASQDTAGPMTRTVRDAAILLSAIAGPDPADPATEAARNYANTDYTRFLDPDGLKDCRLGVARRFFGFHPLEDELMEEALGQMSRLGAVIVDPVDIPSQEKWKEAEFELLLYEFKDGLNRYLQTNGSELPVKSLADLIQFNIDYADQMMPYFGQEILEMAAEKGGLTDKGYLQARQRCLQMTREKGIDAAFARHDLDALISPTTGPAWLIDPINGDSSVGANSSIAAVAGYPHLTLPLGLVHDLPVNLSLIGRPWTEGLLLQLGYAYEQATMARRPPKFLGTIRFP